MWPTDRTGVRLGVKAPIQRVVVLRLALRAHDEVPHGGQRAVVGNVGDDSEARAAIGAIGERVTVTAVGRVQQFAQAIGAGGDVGRDELVAPLLRHTVANLEGRGADRRHIGDLDAFYTRQGRRFPLQITHKRRQRGCRAFDLDLHPAGMIKHPAGQTIFVRQAIDEGTETDPLHHAAHADRLPYQPARHLSTSQSIHSCTPSPVLQDMGKKATSGFSASTPRRK